MANYCMTLLSNNFKVKKEEVENVRRAIAYYEESCINEDGNTVIASYENGIDDDVTVVIDKRTNKVVGTCDIGYFDTTDLIEEECEFIEKSLKDANIKSEDEYDINDFLEVPFYKYIQSVLEDGEYALIKEVGNEKLRYSIACGLLITKDSDTWLDIDHIAKRIVNKEIEM